MGEVADPAATGSRNVKLFGVITIFLGILVIASPIIVGVSVILIVGLLVLAGGITRMIWAFHAGSLGEFPVARPVVYLDEDDCLLKNVKIFLVSWEDQNEDVRNLHSVSSRSADDGYMLGVLRDEKW